MATKLIAGVRAPRFKIVRENVAPVRRIAGVRKPVPQPQRPSNPAYPARRGDPMVNFRVPWDRLEVGWDIAARAWARALELVGVDVRLPPSKNLDDEVRLEVEHLAIQGGGFDVHVMSGAFMTARRLEPVLKELARHPKKRIFHTMFERRRFDPSIVRSLAELNGVWVPCSANRRTLENLGLQNVQNFGVPHFDNDPLNFLPPPKEARVFYWIGSWSPHKSPDNVIRAFMRAFKPGEAELILKTQYVHESMPSPERVVSELFGKDGWTASNWREHVHIERRRLSQADMVRRVHARGDVYVSASRGEGFDMPAYSAKLARRRVITTDSGGPRDFLGENDVLIPATGEVRVHSDYVMHGWEPYSTVIDYDLDALVKAMQKARSEPVHGDDWPRERFRAHAIGESIKNWMVSL